MPSIYTGKTGLRVKFNELGFAAVAPANSQATAVSLCNAVGLHVIYFENTLNADVCLYVVHPEADPLVAANRQLLMKLSAGRFVAFDSDTMLEFDTGTKMFISAVTVPTSGNFRISHWG
jgi:hypothetical protein